MDWAYVTTVAKNGMPPFTDHCFRNFTLDELPIGRDTWIMDEAYMLQWEQEWLKSIGGNRKASPYEVGYITPVHIHQVTSAGADISWYPNTHDRFHVIQTFLPRDVIVGAALAYEYEKRVSVFVKSDWLRKLHIRSNSIFTLIDAVDMAEAIKSGAISHTKVIALRDALDDFAARNPLSSFISFADSLLIKTNWTTGMVNTDVIYTYAPEAVFSMFQKLQKIYRKTIGLEIYGAFAQGSNEYYDDPSLHISATQNHVSLNSLGLPFAQVSLIEAAARQAIKAGTHPPMEIYIDNDLFHSLKFSNYDRKGRWPSAPYKSKMTSAPPMYYFGMCDDLLSCLNLS